MKKRSIKKVTIIPGCISCGTCEVVCPAVFEVKDISYVKPQADFDKHAASIDEAVQVCPVSVIKVEKEEE
jgi:ferredoxin